MQQIAADSFTKVRDAIMAELKKTHEKTKTLSFTKAMEEYRKLFSAVMKEHGLNAELLAKRGPDEPTEGHSALSTSFKYIPTDMANILLNDWKEVESNDIGQQFYLENFHRNFARVDDIWNLLGKESRRVISASVDVMDRFFDELISTKNISETEKIFSELGIRQVFAIKKTFSENSDYLHEVMKKKLDKVSIGDAIDFIHSDFSDYAGTYEEKEALYSSLVKRDDFKKVPFEKAQSYINRTRSRVLIKGFLFSIDEKDLPTDMLVSKVVYEAVLENARKMHLNH